MTLKKTAAKNWDIVPLAVGFFHMLLKSKKKKQNKTKRKNLKCPKPRGSGVIFKDITLGVRYKYETSVKRSLGRRGSRARRYLQSSIYDEFMLASVRLKNAQFNFVCLSEVFFQIYIFGPLYQSYFPQNSFYFLWSSLIFLLT